MPLFHGQRALLTATFSCLFCIPLMFGQMLQQSSDQNGQNVPPAQSSNKSEARIQPGTPASASEGSTSHPHDEPKRIAGIFPNFGTQRIDRPYAPISAKEKFRLAVLNSSSPSIVLLPAITAGIEQAGDTEGTSYGQGPSGYFKRFGANVGDGLIGNFYVNGLLPSLLHQDPRFFSKRTGSVKSRIGWALRQAIISRWDDGSYHLNVAEIAGTAMAAATSMAYRPDDRNAADASRVWATRIGSDSLGNILNEFAPEIRQLFGRRKRP